MKKVILPNYQHHRILIFDGVCNFCNAGVKFIIKHDKNANISFVAAQSPTGEHIQSILGIDVIKDDCSFFYDQGKIYSHAKGSLYIYQYLDPWWLKLISILRFLPAWLLNPAYNFLSKNRYKWFGKRDHCMLPTDNIRFRFIEDYNAHSI